MYFWVSKSVKQKHRDAQSKTFSVKKIENIGKHQVHEEHNGCTEYPRPGDIRKMEYKQGRSLINKLILRN